LADADARPDPGAEILEDSRPRRRILCFRRYAPVLGAVLEDPDSWIERAQSRDRIKHDRTTTVVRIALPDASFYLKRYNTKNAWHALRRAFRRSRAQNCWTMSQRFSAAGIGVAPPAALIQETFGPLRLRSYFITESVAGTRLPLALERAPGAAPDLARQLSGIFRALAKHRMSHGDFKASNILVGPEGRLRLLDLDAARRHRLAATHRRAWRKDRERLLRNFADAPALLEIFGAAIPISLPGDAEQ
jgi:hypothetical protein